MGTCDAGRPTCSECGFDPTSCVNVSRYPFSGIVMYQIYLYRSLSEWSWFNGHTANRGRSARNIRKMEKDEE
jgi:hypothetical protein